MVMIVYDYLVITVTTLSSLYNYCSEYMFSIYIAVT